MRRRVKSGCGNSHDCLMLHPVDFCFHASGSERVTFLKTRTTTYSRTRRRARGGKPPRVRECNCANATSGNLPAAFPTIPYKVTCDSGPPEFTAMELVMVPPECFAPPRGARELNGRRRANLRHQMAWPGSKSHRPAARAPDLCRWERK